MQAYIVRAATPLHGHIKTHLKAIQFFHLMMIVQKDQGSISSVISSQYWITTKDSL